MNDKDEGLREALADLEHRRWASWQKYVHNLSPLNEKGERVIPASSVEHWERQIATDYKDLTEREKDMDRKEADKTLEVISRHPAPAEVEPLAVLADRKGKNYGHSLRIYRMPKGWVIDIIGLYRNTIIGCDTYAAAEAKAKSYLISLPDKK